MQRRFPPNTIFIFTCNATESLEKRFLSRCRTIEFSSYGMASEIVGLLTTIWDKESNSPNERRRTPTKPEISLAFMAQAWSCSVKVGRGTRDPSSGHKGEQHFGANSQ